MKFKASLFALAFMAIANIASAQTHPCDATPPPPAPGQPPVAVGFCHSGKDADGKVVTITKFTIEIDGVKVFEGPLTPVGAASATGFNYYETPKSVIPTVGTHNVTVRAWSSGGSGALSVPLPFEILGSIPEAAVKVRIIR